jgi:hypothetical protein
VIQFYFTNYKFFIDEMIMHFNVLCECMENKVINNFVATRTMIEIFCSLPYDKS